MITALASRRLAVSCPSANQAWASLTSRWDSVVSRWVDPPLSPVVRSFALREWTRIVVGLQREELRDEHPLTVGGDRDPMGLDADALDGVGHLVASRVDYRDGA